MRLKKGMAGLVLLVMVLGYMMSISTSITMLTQSESTGKAARKGYKNAYGAALAGIGVVISRLRLEPTTFDVDPTKRPYFVRIAADINNHYCDWTASQKTYTGYTRLIAPGWLTVSSTFAINTGTKVDDYQFQICSYPKTDPVTLYEYYFVKSQGKFTDAESEKEFKAQIWARFRINASAKLIALETFGTMGVQDLTWVTATNVNDFWDWQSEYK